MSIRITDLPSSSLPYSGSEEFLIVQNGVTTSNSINSLATYLSGNNIVVNTSNTVTAISSATQNQKQSLLPNTVEIDYIKLADQTGYTIPENSLGQKNNVAYFGNRMIASPPPKFIIKSLANVLSGSQRWNQPLAKFQIPEGWFSNTGNYFLVEINLCVEYTSTVPSPQSFEACLVFAHEAEWQSILSNPSSVSADLVFDLSPVTNGHRLVTLQGNWIVNATTTGTLGGNFANLIKYSSVDSSTDPDSFKVMKQPIDFGGSLGGGPSSPGVSENFYVAIVSLTGTFRPLITQGYVNFYKIENMNEDNE